VLRRAPNTTVSTARLSARELMQQNRSEADFNQLILHLARLLKADVHPRLATSGLCHDREPESLPSDNSRLFDQARAVDPRRSQMRMRVAVTTTRPA